MGYLAFLLAHVRVLTKDYSEIDGVTRTGGESADPPYPIRTEEIEVRIRLPCRIDGNRKSPVESVTYPRARRPTRAVQNSMIHSLISLRSCVWMRWPESKRCRCVSMPAVSRTRCACCAAEAGTSLLSRPCAMSTRKRLASGSQMIGP